MYLLILYILKLLLAITTLAILSIFIYVLFYEANLRAGVCRCKSRLDGKTVLITGGNAGIGLETAKDLARRGARVIIADVVNAERTVEEIKQLTGNKNVEYRELHLESFDRIVEFAEDIKKSVDKLDILVNNAGTGDSNGRPTEDGINLIMQVNYYGPFLLTALLLDKLIASKASRIIIVTSNTYKYARLKLDDLFGLTEEKNLACYAKSKLCDVLWMKALAKRLPRGVTVNSLHPGIVNTKIYNSINVPYVRSLIYILIGIFFKTPVQGAQTTIHLCAADNLDNSTGNHYTNCKIEKIAKEAEIKELVEKVWHKTVVTFKEYYQKRGEKFQPSESVLFE